MNYKYLTVIIQLATISRNSRKIDKPMNSDMEYNFREYIFNWKMYIKKRSTLFSEVVEVHC